MNHRRSRLLAAILLSCFSAIVIGCGSVQSPHDGSAGGAGGTTGTGGGGITGGAGTTGSAGTMGAAGGGGNSAGTGGRGGAGGADGNVTCGMATCTTGQSCCNASCGICVATGGGCTQQICTALSWTYTCGRSICVNTDAGATDGGSSLPPCTADQKLNGPCPTLGQMCDPRDNSCGRMFVCATGPMPCPL